MDRQISIFFSQVQKTMVNSYHQFENVSPDALPYGNSLNRGLHLNCKETKTKIHYSQIDYELFG